MLALVVAALWIVGITLDGVLGRDSSRNSFARLIPIADLIAAASVACSLALSWWAGREGQNPRVTLNAGLGYLVFTAFSLGLITHWDHTSSPAPIHSMISWDGILIMTFAAIVPTSPQRMAVAGCSPAR